MRLLLLLFFSFYDFNLPRFCFMVFLSDFSACICYSAFPLLDYYRSFPEFFMELNSEKKRDTTKENDVNAVASHKRVNFTHVDCPVYVG